MELSREADFSTQQHEARTQAWLPQADVDACGPPGAEAPPLKGPQAFVRLSPGGQGRRQWRALSGKRDFSRVYEEGVKHVGRLVVLYLFPGDDQARAVVASRKVGNAVTRNRAKRLLREAIRSRIEKEPRTVAEIERRTWPDAMSGEGLWLVAVARRRIVDKKFQDVAAEFDQLLSRPPAPEPGESRQDPGDRATRDARQT